MTRRFFTSESVTEGHPDKICDRISDSILDAILAIDPDARVAVETLVTTGLVHVAGEIRTEAYIDVQNIAREVIAGMWGNGAARAEALGKAGHNAEAVQAEVNRILFG